MLTQQFRSTFLVYSSPHPLPLRPNNLDQTLADISNWFLRAGLLHPRVPQTQDRHTILMTKDTFVPNTAAILGVCLMSEQIPYSHHSWVLFSSYLEMCRSGNDQTRIL